MCPREIFFGATRNGTLVDMVHRCGWALKCMPQRFSLETVMKMRQVGDDQWQVAEKS